MDGPLTVPCYRATRGCGNRRALLGDRVTSPRPGDDHDDDEDEGMVLMDVLTQIQHAYRLALLPHNYCSDYSGLHLPCHGALHCLLT